MSEAARPDLDLFARPVSAVLLWGVPLVALVVTGIAPVGMTARTITWTIALASAGFACLVNARGSGRLHCHMTGPFYLLLALASSLHGTGALPLGSHGWTSIGLVLVVGSVLTLVPERILGKYGRGRAGCC